jgi:hypothetical protein
MSHSTLGPRASASTVRIHKSSLRQDFGNKVGKHGAENCATLSKRSTDLLLFVANILAFKFDGSVCSDWGKQLEDFSIRSIVEGVTRGQIRIPAFQRGFVWDAERVAYLMDSIYKGYPFGSLMFWRTREQLKFDRDLGPFQLPPPKEDYPVDYVLDGQQRVTSIFGVFQTDMKPALSSGAAGLRSALRHRPLGRPAASTHGRLSERLAAANAWRNVHVNVWGRR